MNNEESNLSRLTETPVKVRQDSDIDVNPESGHFPEQKFKGLLKQIQELLGDNKFAEAEAARVKAQAYAVSDEYQNFMHSSSKAPQKKSERENTKQDPLEILSSSL